MIKKNNNNILLLLVTTCLFMFVFNSLVVVTIIDAKKVLSDGKVVSLKVKKIDELQNALFGGDVWVISCQKDNEQVDQFLVAAASLFGKDSECDGHCFVGTLDCNRKLPSKKTVLKRFNLKKVKNVPLLFVAANGNKPYQLTDVKVFTKPVKGKKNTREFSAKKLVKHVSKNSRPRLFTVTKPSDFQTYCLKRRYCVAFALGRNGGGDGRSGKKKKKRKRKSPTLNSNQKKVVNKLLRKHRNVGFVVIDTSKWELEVLGENIEGFQKKDDDVSTIDYPTIVAFRKDVNDTTLGKGRFRHLNKKIKEGTSAMSMSLCRHLIHSNTTKEEARKIFKAHRINFKTFKEKPVSLLRHENVLYRINKKYYTWKTAASYIASEMLFKQALPSSLMEKIDNHTAKDDKLKRKKARTDVQVVSAKKYDPKNNNKKKRKERYFSESGLDKFIQSIPKSKEFKMAETPPNIKKFLSIAEKTEMEEAKKRKKMQNLQKRRKREKAAKKRSERVKKRSERKMKRKNRRGGANSKEELQKEQSRRERERREEMDREMEQFGATAVDDDDDDDDTYDDNDNDNNDDDTYDDNDDDHISYDVDSDGETTMYGDDYDDDSNEDDDEVVDLGDLEDDYDDDM